MVYKGSYFYSNPINNITKDPEKERHSMTTSTGLYTSCTLNYMRYCSSFIKQVFMLISCYQFVTNIMSFNTLSNQVCFKIHVYLNLNT